MSIGGFVTVLVGVALVSIAIVYCVVPWRGDHAQHRGVLAEAFIITAIPGVALLIRGRGRRFSGQTIAGCALVSIGLSTLLFEQIDRLVGPFGLGPGATILFPTILSAAGLLLILIPMRQPPATLAIARGYLLSGGAILIMAVANTFVLTPLWFFGEEARLGAAECQYRLYESLEWARIGYPALYAVCGRFRDAELQLQAIGSLTGLVLVAAGVVALSLIRRAANRPVQSGAPLN
jgi:hypothetical protein